MKKCVFLVVMFLLLAVPAMASDSGRPMGPPPGASGKGPSGPPPEAYEACEGKVEGDTVSITTPRGDIIEGVCTDHDGRLALRPTSPPPSPPAGKSE